MGVRRKGDRPPTKCETHLASSLPAARPQGAQGPALPRPKRSFPGLHPCGPTCHALAAAQVLCLLLAAPWPHVVQAGGGASSYSVGRAAGLLSSFHGSHCAWCFEAPVSNRCLPGAAPQPVEPGECRRRGRMRGSGVRDAGEWEGDTGSGGLGGVREAPSASRTSPQTCTATNSSLMAMAEPPSSARHTSACPSAPPHTWTSLVSCGYPRTPRPPDNKDGAQCCPPLLHSKWPNE